MSDFYPIPQRAEVANALRSMDPPLIEGMRVRPSDLVLELGNTERYGSHTLSTDGEQLSGGSPRHWRILMPSRVDPHSLRAIEFGLPAMDMPQSESRFTHELFVDATVDLNEAVNPAVRQLYKRVGGLLVKATSEQAHTVFAAIEVNYKPISDEESVRWAQLFYSKALLETHKYLTVNPKKNNPRWLRQAIMPRHSEKAAQAMALSSLVAHRKVQQQHFPEY